MIIGLPVSFQYCPGTQFENLLELERHATAKDSYGLSLESVPLNTVYWFSSNSAPGIATCVTVPPLIHTLQWQRLFFTWSFHNHISSSLFYCTRREEVVKHNDCYMTKLNKEHISTVRLQRDHMCRAESSQPWCIAQSRKANSCCSLIWVKIVSVFSLAHCFRRDWQLGQTKSFHWLLSQ